MNIHKHLVAIGTTFAMTTAALGVAVLGVASPASAWSASPRDGSCDIDEFCFYFFQNQRGSVSDFDQSVVAYGQNTNTCYVFKGPGTGVDHCILNMAESVSNRTRYTVRVYTAGNLQGTYQEFGPNSDGNLNEKLRNHNGSHIIIIH